MCTAATYKTKDFYMGRTLDYEFSYGEQITITPRNYEFDFRFAGKIKSHYALIGMAFVAGGYPLYYDAVNEKGLGMAGLNFVGNAAYEEALPEDETEVSQVAQFEFIPWILTQCATVAEAREKLAAMRLTGTAFSEQLPTAQLHWIIADKDSCIVVESMRGTVLLLPGLCPRRVRRAAGRGPGPGAYVHHAGLLVHPAGQLYHPGPEGLAGYCHHFLGLSHHLERQLCGVPDLLPEGRLGPRPGKEPVNTMQPPDEEFSSGG